MITGSACWRPCSPPIAGTSAMGICEALLATLRRSLGVNQRVLPEDDLKAVARREPTGKTWAQMFSVIFGLKRTCKRATNLTYVILALSDIAI